MSLSKEQLEELTERVNARLAEFGERMFDPMSAGVVRIVVDVIEAHWDVDGVSVEVRAWPKPADLNIGDPLQDGYHIGYQTARREMAAANGTENGPAVVTNSAPEPQMISRMPVVVSPMIHEPVLAFVRGEGRVDESQEADKSQKASIVVAGTTPEPTPTPELPHAAITFKPVGAGRTLVEVDADTDASAELAAAGATLTGGTAVRARLTTEEKATQWREILAALQDMAVDGMMPTTAFWNEHKPAHLPVWQTISGRWYIDSWGELAARAKLEYSGKPGKRVSADPTPPA